MATDKSEPRVGLILKIASASIVTLIATHAALTSYFDRIARAEEDRKWGEVKPEALMAERADEKTRLSSGATPVDKTMQQIAQRGRTEASPEIAPSASKDVEPLKGWMQMQSPVPPAMTAPEPEPAPSALPAVDAGATKAAVDGGTPKGTKQDGGTLTKPPPKHP
jgi:hypothetical protein